MALVLLCWLVLGGILVEVGVSRHTLDGEDLGVWEVLPLMLVEGVPVDSGPGQVGGIDGWISDFLLKVKLAHGNLLLGELHVVSIEPDTHHLPGHSAGPAETSS